MIYINDLFKLDDHVALVTGGGRGLGYSSTEGLAEICAYLAICGGYFHGSIRSEEFRC